MTKIKVKINAASPSAEIINQYRSFDRFMDRYRRYYSTSGIRSMLYNDRKKLVYIVIIVLFLLLMLFIEDVNNNETSTPPATEQTE